MLIHNFGLEWEWHSSLRNGLYGRAGRGEPIDFYFQIGLYVLKKGSRIVYVGKGRGQKNAIGERLLRHSREKIGEWNRFCWFGFVPESAIDSEGRIPKAPSISTDTEVAVADIEALLIYLLQPKLNKVPGAYKHMTEYVQYWSD